MSPNVVKVVTDKKGNALYFSRSPIPFPREAVIEFGSLEAALKADPQLLSAFRKHNGLYAYRREFLLRYTELAPSPLERTEMLEQLRILEFGEVIKVVETAEASLGIDTQADLERARAMLEAAV
jgi:3-deoxy-manno-octulosonate cytidylyltransferase (CMP-KDO synthetase)